MYNILSSFYSLIKKENISNLDIFLKDFETFEEIPLVSRLDNIRNLENIFSGEDIQFFLINSSIFIMNNILQHAKKKLDVPDSLNFFTCLTFPDMDEIEDMGYVIPHFLVTRKSGLFDFLHRGNESALESLHPVLSKAFLDVGAGKSFRFIKIITKDNVYGDVTRIYAVPIHSLLVN